MKPFIVIYLVVAFFIYRYFNKSASILREKNLKIEKDLESWNFEKSKSLFPIRHILKFKDIYYNMPTVYIITPTYARSTQLADLTRMKNTLLLVPKLVWILVEDSNEKTNKIINFVRRSKLNVIHLNVKTLHMEKQKGKISHKGVEQRNLGLKWLKDNKIENGVFYFADDDNSYDLRLFEEIRSVKKIGVWPVGLVGGAKYERPVCNDNKVVDWFYAYNPHRYFPTDMGSFGVNTKMLHNLDDVYFERFTKADLEGVFLKKFNFKIYDLEGKANNCMQVYVWHTRTKREAIKNYTLLKQNFLEQI